LIWDLLNTKQECSPLGGAVRYWGVKLWGRSDVGDLGIHDRIILKQIYKVCGYGFDKLRSGSNDGFVSEGYWTLLKY
jgi:hypothetical protein